MKVLKQNRVLGGLACMVFSLILMAVDAGDIIDLQNDFHLRGNDLNFSKKFVGANSNVIGILPKGAKFIVKKVVDFPHSNNSGLEIFILSPEGLAKKYNSKPELWIHFKKTAPMMAIDKSYYGNTYIRSAHDQASLEDCQKNPFACIGTNQADRPMVDGQKQCKYLKLQQVPNPICDNNPGLPPLQHGVTPDAHNVVDPGGAGSESYNRQEELLNRFLARAAATAWGVNYPGFLGPKISDLLTCGAGDSASVNSADAAVPLDCRAPPNQVSPDSTGTKYITRPMDAEISQKDISDAAKSDEVKGVLAKISQGQSKWDSLLPLQKLRAIHDWMTSNVSYPAEDFCSGKENPPSPEGKNPKVYKKEYDDYISYLKKYSDPVEMIKNAGDDGQIKGMCNGNAALFAALSTAAGINDVHAVKGQVDIDAKWRMDRKLPLAKSIIPGVDSSSLSTHAWNQVHLGDKVLNIDVTFDMGAVSCPGMYSIYSNNTDKAQFVRNNGSAQSHYFLNNGAFIHDHFLVGDASGKCLNPGSERVSPSISTPDPAPNNSRHCKGLCGMVHGIFSALGIHL